jgi:hypothetical protein
MTVPNAYLTSENEMAVLDYLQSMEQHLRWAIRNGGLGFVDNPELPADGELPICGSFEGPKTRRCQNCRVRWEMHEAAGKVPAPAPSQAPIVVFMREVKALLDHLLGASPDDFRAGVWKDLFEQGLSGQEAVEVHLIEMGLVESVDELGLA